MFLRFRTRNLSVLKYYVCLPDRHRPTNERRFLTYTYIYTRCAYSKSATKVSRLKIDRICIYIYYEVYIPRVSRNVHYYYFSLLSDKNCVNCSASRNALYCHRSVLYECEGDDLVLKFITPATNTSLYNARRSVLVLPARKRRFQRARAKSVCPVFILNRAPCCISIRTITLCRVENDDGGDETFVFSTPNER